MVNDNALSALVLRAETLEVWRADHCLFTALEFELGPGRIALVTGANGAGKSTLLRTLAGLAEPTAGQVFWAGRRVRALPPERRADIAYRGHADGLKGDLTVRENLEFCRRLRGSGDRIEEPARELRLESKLDARVRHLSAGQRRRVALAALRLAGARLWILDEPMTHLDAPGRALVTDWIRAHVRNDGLAIAATHRPEELAEPGALVIEL